MSSNLTNMNTRNRPRAAAKKKLNGTVCTIIDTFVAGFVHGEWDVNKLIPQGTELVMTFDPKNLYDTSAIKLVTKTGIKVGFLPRADGTHGSGIIGYQKVWTEIRKGIPMRCIVMNHARSNATHRALKIRVEGLYQNPELQKNEQQVPSF